MGQSTPTRRQFLQHSVAFAAVSGLLEPAFGQEPRVLAYVGTYTGNGEGIYLFQMSPRSGELSMVKLAAKASNPSWISLSPSGHFLYSVNEDSPGMVSAYAINRTTGDLRLLNSVSSGGEGPAHLSVDGSGKYVFVANYGDGSIEVLPISAAFGEGMDEFKKAIREQSA